MIDDCFLLSRAQETAIHCPIVTQSDQCEIDKFIVRRRRDLPESKAGNGRQKILLVRCIRDQG